jgi:hypothetical protein
VTDEKRRFSRIPFDATVLLSTGGKEWRTAMLDISLNGLLVRAPEDWDPVVGQQLNAEILFSDAGPVISAEVAVAHRQDGRVGLQVANIDVDSVAHLRRLVELNLGDAALLNRELELLNWK